ncbi:MAG: hypothetical protein ISR96_05410 [Nitrospira sp.]|nr:hypothetical protein [bacterium]MBL7048937.1 hypothetical protein [Nitrospira sp.]
MIIESLKEGIYLGLSNYRTVLIRLVFSLFNLLLLAVFAAVPILVAVAQSGMDWSDAGEIVSGLLHSPLQYLGQYLGVLLIAGTSFAFYLMVSSFLYIFVLGGTLGMLLKKVAAPDYQASYSAFFAECGKNFFRLTRLIYLVLAGGFALSLAAAMLGTTLNAAMHLIIVSWPVTEAVLMTFNQVSGAVFGVILLSVLLATAAFSAVLSVENEMNSPDSVQGAIRLILDRPVVVCLFTAMLLIYVIINIVLFSLIQALGVTAFVLALIVKNYLTVVIWTVLTVYCRQFGEQRLYETQSLNGSLMATSYSSTHQ